MTIISLLDFWKLQRKYNGEITVIRPCHKRKAEALTDLLLGKIPTPNLMILEPPRVGKTDLSVKAFQAWASSFFPDSEFINASYADTLAVDNNKFIRQTLTSDWYRSICASDWGANVLMKGDSAGGRQDFFYTKEGGSFKAIGVGGGITGFGAGKLRKEFGGCINVDDPLKAQDKDSMTERKNCIDWFHGTLESRRNRKKAPMTPIVLDMQRLHPQDLAGHLLSTQRDRWTVVEIPAIDEDGESIWPERISLEEMEYMKEYDPDTYWAQYMQQPSDEAYTIFKPHWWKFWDNINAVEKRITLKIITADTAFKDKDSSDYSVFQCWGFEKYIGIYLLDQIRGKWTFPDLVTNAEYFLKKHRKLIHGITPVTECWVEDKASGTSLVQTLRKAGLPFKEWLPPNPKQKIIEKEQVLSGKDKVSRAKQCTMPISAGRVFLPYPLMQGYRWVENFVAEHSAFTIDDSHLYDDQVDGETMALLIWQQRGGGVGQLPQWKNLPVWEYGMKSAA